MNIEKRYLYALQSGTSIYNVRVLTEREAVDQMRRNDVLEKGTEKPLRIEKLSNKEYVGVDLQ